MKHTYVPLRGLQKHQIERALSLLKSFLIYKGIIVQDIFKEEIDELEYRIRIGDIK